MQTPEDRFYNPTRINGWFAVSAVLVLATSVAAVLADHYDREWKGYQQSFQALDRKLAGETIALNKPGQGSPKAGAAAIRDRLLERKSPEGATPEDAAKADAAHFEKGIQETRDLPEFAAGAVLAARAYDEQAEKAKTEELLGAVAEIEKVRDASENARFKAEKEQRELQALVDEFKFEMDHAVGQGHDVEAKIARAKWEEFVGKEKQVHNVMDGHFADKMKRIEEMRAAMTPVTRLSDRARRLDEAAGLVTAERKMRSYVIQGVRDAPLVDFVAPVTKIEQKVFPDLTVDYNFALIGRVDRCITCHRGIDKVKVDPETGAVSPLFTAANTPEKVFRTHSRPELFVSSVHSPDRIGCTVCHDGLGWGLSFNDAYHMPSTPEQEKEWKEKYHWHKGESWDFPMLPLKHIEASCFKCHRDPVLAKPEDKFAKEIQAAPKWNRGMRLVEDRGCFACHKIDGFAVDGLDKWIGEIPDPEQRGSAMATSIRKPGPSLKRIDRKWPSKEAAHKWVWHPKGLRPTTTMPRFFGQPNNTGRDELTGEDYDARTRTEVWGIVSYLWDDKVKLDEDRAWTPGKPPVKGDAARGKGLFGGLDDEDLPISIGCIACHSTKDFPHPEDGKVNDFGPELSSIGSKTSEAWLYTWLRDPSAAWHGTRMPNLRLTEQQAADLAAYLATLRDEKWEKEETPPPVEEAFVKKLAFEAVRIAGKKGEENPAAVVEKMTMEERLRRIGERAIGKYACFSCHDIQGFDGKERIGTELGGGEGWGSKDVDRLDFGVMEDPKAVATFSSWGAKWLPHRKAEWAFLKLKNPRIFDAGITKQPHEKLLMPNFDFTDDEADAVVTFLLSLQRGEVPGSKRRLRDARETQAEKMKWIARQYNCYGCHTVTREERVGSDGTRFAAARGGDIRPWLGEEKAHWPPTLGGEDKLPEDPANPKKARPTWGPAKSGEGSKVQPAWLYSFLRHPEDPADPSKNMLRYWMTTRMPTFPLTQQELNHLVHGFAAADGFPFPFESEQAKPLDKKDHADAKGLFTAMACFQCHKTGSMDFGVKAPSAPDLAFTGARLRYEWVRKWLHKPSLLQPGTKMPQNWSPEKDEKGDVKKDKDGREILMGADVKAPDGGRFFGNDPQVQMRKIADFIYTIDGKPPEGGTK